MLQSTENCTARPRLVFKEGFTKLRVGGAEKEFQNYILKQCGFDFYWNFYNFFASLFSVEF